MSNTYKLIESWHKASSQDRVYYVDAEANLTTWVAQAKPKFGDKALALAEGTVWVVNSQGVLVKI